MIRRPLPAWIDLARGNAVLDSGPNADGGEAPMVDAPRRGENDNGGAMPALALPGNGPAAALLPGGPTRGRRLGVTIAVILSTVIHAAAFAWLAGSPSVAGMDPDAEGVSVEIVFDLPATSASPAIAGNDGAAVADAEPAEIVEPTLAEAVEPDLARLEQAPEPAKPRDDALAVEPEAVAPVATEAGEAVEPDAADPADRVERAETGEPAAVAAPESIAEAAADAPVAADIAAPTAAETVMTEPAPVAAEPIKAAIPPVEAAVEPVAPDATRPALLAVPPMVEPAPPAEPARQDAVDIVLPERMESVPQRRPDPSTTGTTTAQAMAGARQAPQPAPEATRARAAEPSRRSASAETQPGGRTSQAKADAVARSDEKPARRNLGPAASTGRKPATAASAGSQARAAAVPGAEAKYGRRLLSHIERHKRYPAAAQRARISGATRLSITIDRAGGLTGARVSASSGHQILDQEALAVARRAAPYPRPPDGVGGSTFSLSVTLRFTP